jgi:hypothetical protein
MEYGLVFNGKSLVNIRSEFLSPADFYHAIVIQLTHIRSNYSLLCEYNNPAMGSASDGQVNLSEPVNLIAGMPIFGKENLSVKGSDYYTEAMQRSLKNGGDYGPQGFSPLPLYSPAASFDLY